MNGQPPTPSFDGRAATLTLLLLCAATLGVSAVRAVSRPLTAGPEGARYTGQQAGKHIIRIPVDFLPARSQPERSGLASSSSRAETVRRIKTEEGPPPTTCTTWALFRPRSEQEKIRVLRYEMVQLRRRGTAGAFPGVTELSGIRISGTRP